MARMRPQGSDLTITLDAFSGMPNPSWAIEGATAEQVREALADHEEDSQPASANGGILGVRGVVVSYLDGAGLRQSKRFGLSGKASRQMAAHLLATWPGDTALDVEGLTAAMEETENRQAIEAAAVLPAASSGGVLTGRDNAQQDCSNPTRILRPGGSAVEVCDANFEFWNTPGRQAVNNCYAYATNRLQTGSVFPRPGRASGRQLEQPFSEEDLRTAVLADGAVPGATNVPVAQAPRWVLGLVYRPSSWNVDPDYHLYRLTTEPASDLDYYSHKTGGNAAAWFTVNGRLVDDLAHVSHGDYEWVGYYLAPAPMRIS